MFVPIILRSDKTTVSVATGHNEYYPLYMSIGNVHNNIRRAHRNALMLIAFLAIPKGMSFLFSLLRARANLEHFSQQETLRHHSVPELQTPAFSYVPHSNLP